MPLECHFPASEKSVTALIKHHEVCGTTTVTQPIFSPRDAPIMRLQFKRQNDQLRPLFSLGIA